MLRTSEDRDLFRNGPHRKVDPTGIHVGFNADGEPVDPDLEEGRKVLERDTDHVHHVFGLAWDSLTSLEDY